MTPARPSQRAGLRASAAPAVVVAGLYAALLIALMAGAANAQQRPLRLGIHHPRPALCLGDETSQRDLRVLRLAFGVLERPTSRLEAPWFYRPLGDSAGLGVVLALDTEALWGRPVVWLMSSHPEFASLRPLDRLAAWRHATLARLPSAAALPALSMAAFRAPLAPGDPFFASRLAGSTILPYALGRNGTRTTEPCRNWPAGVRLDPPTPGRSYTLHLQPTSRREPTRLLAYEALGEAWREYLRGRLDALLLEGADLDDRLQRYPAASLGAWGLLSGTQQIVLRLSPRLAAQLGSEGRLALSLAVDRRQLARIEGAGRFSAVSSYLAPVTAPDAEGPAEALAWNALRARRLWLGTEREPTRLRIAVLPHPALERIGQAIQAQWSKTLNVNTEVQTWSVDQFQSLLATERADVMVEVVDLDDGSLQDLWLETLRDQPRVLAGGVTVWEAALREQLAYLPLLGNVHLVLLRPNAPPGLLGRVCPGCVPVDSPRRLRVETEEQAGPRG